MKKLFTSVAFLLAALTMQAEEYSGNLHILVPDMEMDVNQAANITVNEQKDGNYELTIEKFNFSGLPVGTINVKDVVATNPDEGLTRLTFDGKSTIQDDGEGGIMVGEEVELHVNGMLTNAGFRANIDIVADNEGAPLPVTVTFTPDGTLSQIPNSNFEAFHTATYTSWGKNYTSTEADHWHSFTSAQASSIYVAARMGSQSAESSEVREGAESKKCLKITSAVIAGKPANGTVTTGRLNAGDMNPSNTKNHAFLDLSNTKKDDNGDPFYTTLSTTPDAIEFWCRFKQGQDNLSNKYASIRAVITDGTYYQDPEDKTYKNIVGVASNKKIEGTDQWQKVTAKFDYDSYAETDETTGEKKALEPKAILVTISTNSEPGVASDDAKKPDYIYIDDLSLIYNAELASLKFKGADLFEAGKKEYTVNATGTISVNDFDFSSNSVSAYEDLELTEVEGGAKATITITSEDLKTQNVYVVNLKGATTAIETPKHLNKKSGIQAIYNLAGQQVSSMASGNVYIVKTTDGKTKKVIKK